MMSVQTDTLLSILTRLGLTEPEGKIFLFLEENGHQTALAISRAMKIGRTRVYRILDSLKARDLVFLRLGDRGLVFEPVPVSSLDMLLHKKRAEIASIESSISILKTEISGAVKMRSTTPKTIFYEGSKGLLTATWNSLDANSMEGIRIYEMSGEMGAFIPHETAEEIRKGFVRRKIQTRQLTNLKMIPGWTDVSDMVWKFWQVRYLDPAMVMIQFEITIYNDIVSLYTFREKLPYCIEIHDANLASMQKQVFDVMWLQATPMKIRSKNGDAAVPV